jgi:integration host factor subunit alpha
MICILPKESLRSQSMTLTKENLVQSLYDQVGLSKQQSRAMIDNVFEIIKKSLDFGDDFLISGFGKFCVKKKAPRRGRNPAIGEELTLDSRRVVTLKCSPVLKKKLTGEG